MLLRNMSVILILAGYALVAPEAQAQCNLCSQCCKDQGSNCCRPNHCKIVIKGNAFGGFVGAAPPQGFAVQSVPALMFHTPSFAASPAMVASTPAAASASVNPASLSDRDIQRIADAVRRPGATSADVNSSTKCDDPCGSILQLRRDVNDLISVTDKLTRVVEGLTAESQKNKSAAQ